MKILSVDTSSAICSISILENEEVIDEINIDNGKTHSENLMPSISQILEKNKIKLSDIDLISCVVGPRVIYRNQNWYFKYKSNS